MQKLLCKILALVNVAIIIGMIVTGYAYYLNPLTWGVLSLAGYGFPLFLISNILMIIVWVLVRLRYVFIPVLGMIACYMPVMKYSPVNPPASVPDDCITVLTYNTWSYGTASDSAAATSSEEVRARVLQYIHDTKAEIVCLQESSLTDLIKEEMQNVFSDRKMYVDTLYHGASSHLMCISSYPIVRKERVVFDSNGNVTGAFTVDVDGKKIIVVNNHLETNSFTAEEKDNFSDVMHGKQGKRAYVKESRYVSDKLVDAAKIRAPQAEAVASFVRMHKGVPMILCGDFNDIPLSYAHKTIAHELTDCYRATGFGPGFTYSKYAMRVRIDNIMCSDHFTPYDCYVDKSIGMSDHYPVICKLSMD